MGTGCREAPPVFIKTTQLTSQNRHFRGNPGSAMQMHPNKHQGVVADRGVDTLCTILKNPGCMRVLIVIDGAGYQ